jgi:hypothetical protein
LTFALAAVVRLIIWIAPFLLETQSYRKGPVK